MIRTLFVFSLLLAYANSAVAAPLAQCNLEPIRRTINPVPNRVGLSLDSVELFFTEKEITRTDADGTPFKFDVMIPTLRLRAPLAVLVESMKQQTIQGIINSKPGDIDIENIRFDPATIGSQRTLTLPGRFEVEKWWKMDGFCCQWFSCRRCEWKTRVLSRTVEFTGTLNNLPQAGGVVPSRTEAGNEASIATLPQHTGAKLLLSASGSISNDRNDLEKIWDFVAGLLEKIGSVFNGNDNLQIEDFIGKQYDVEDQAIDAPNVAHRRAEAFAYDTNIVKTNKVRTYESRDAWEAFNAGLFFSPDTTGFVHDSAKQTLLMTYQFDYDRYTQVLNSSALAARLTARTKNTGGRRTGTVFDILDKNLCNAMRPNFEAYVNALAEKFNGADNQPSLIAYSTRAELLVGLQKKYSMGGAEELFRTAKLGISDVRNEKNIIAPSIVAIDNSKWVMPAQGNLWAAARQNNWSDAEYRCARRAAKQRSGSADRVYQFQSFAECAEGETMEAFAATLFSMVEKKFGPEIFTDFRGSGPPIRGDMYYRGWYYCYQNPSICAGRKRVTWWTAPSEFDARGGVHKGLDLIHGSPDENIPLLAAVEGQLIYNDANPRGWGHALIIPFQKDQVKYMAVYAHLPASAKSLDGKRVKIGDSLGQAGCSGNAGNGSGQCNNYCQVDTSLRASDVHLHFELLKKDENGGTSSVPVSSFSVIPMNIKNGAPRRLYVCQDES